MTMALPQALGPTALAAMQRRLLAEVDARIDRAAGSALPDADRRESLRALLLQGLRLGKPVADGLLDTALLAPPDYAVRLAAAIGSLFPPQEHARIVAAGAERAEADRYAPLFGTADRLFLPLQEAAGSEVRQAVAAALEPAGYTVEDYAAGKALDAAGKQRFRIGKLLDRLDPALSLRFQQDSSRTRDRLLVCLSRDPMDIARMSTGRAWGSCMNIDGLNWDYVPQEVRYGTLVAYLLRPSDPELTAPLARILLKPYAGADGARLFHAGTAYGLENADFAATVAGIARQLSAAQPAGRYTLRDELYNDDQPDALLQLPEAQPSAEVFLTVAGVAWQRDAAGGLRVEGDLDLSRLGLDALPDLSAVHVTGDFRCNGNRLTSLVGMPQRIDGDISAQFNLLEDLQGLPADIRGDLRLGCNALTRLAGAPAEIGGSFDVTGNRLESLRGGPLRVGKDYGCSSNELRDLHGSPAEIPGSFGCNGNELASLAGAPRRVGGDFSARRCRLPVLTGGPAHVGGMFMVANNVLTDLRGAPREVGGDLDASSNPLVSLYGLSQRFDVLSCKLGRFATREEIPAALLARPRLPQATPAP